MLHSTQAEPLRLKHLHLRIGLASEATCKCYLRDQDRRSVPISHTYTCWMLAFNGQNTLYHWITS